MNPGLSKKTKLILGSVLVTYLILMAVKAWVPETAPVIGILIWLQEIGLNLGALYLVSLHLRKKDPADTAFDRCAYQCLAASLVFTLTASTTYQILSRGFGWTLEKAMGTPVELAINIPYMSFFAFGLVALWRGHNGYAPKANKTALLSLVLFVMTVLAFRHGLAATENPLQNRTIHWMCFALECAILTVGVINALAPPLSLRFVSLAYVCIAASGYLFQIYEIYPTIPYLDFPIDASWTLGQLLLVSGLSLTGSEKLRA